MVAGPHLPLLRIALSGIGAASPGELCPLPRSQILIMINDMGEQRAIFFFATKWKPLGSAFNSAELLIALG